MQLYKALSWEEEEGEVLSLVPDYAVITEMSDRSYCTTTTTTIATVSSSNK